MFCPKCATQNVEGASFCRSCGANISLVSQALTGQLPTKTVDDENCLPGSFRGRRLSQLRRREPSVENATRNLVMAVAFIAISVLVGKYSPGGWTWWYWMLIPAATFLGKGISDLARLKQAKNQAPVFASPQLNTVRPSASPVPRTGQLMTPVASVTEGTTRHLGTEAATQHFDSFGSQKPS